MSDLAVVSACFGGYDAPRGAVPQSVDADWWYASEEPGELPGPWQGIAAVRQDGISPRLQAKAWKLRPWEPLELHGGPYDVVVWLDANMEVTNPNFLAMCLELVRTGAELSTWRHPQRDCIYEEASASLRLRPEAYGSLPIREQAEHYRSEGYPEHAGLYACGTLVWRASNPAARALGHAWLYECERWTIQDQLSLPVVCRRLGITPATIPGRQVEGKRRNQEGPWLQNSWLRIHPHLQQA